MEHLRKWHFFEIVAEEAVQHWIKKDSKFECYEVSSDDDIMTRVVCGSEKTSNFEFPECDEENLVTHQKISHQDT